ncbi:uncharacterized protein LOC117101097 [Anneissia japonica]|uniref:uncharacterized protein LOC117101097 n=1 Tax=Anneissia japonica TaxID=1529436 RepID=UPI0014255216|nr:uncharacterized protein LOC117101097 [Anneissia japonica]
MMHNGLRILLLILFVVICALEETDARKQYNFRRYQYKKKPKIEKKYKNELMKCERSQECSQLASLEKINCARRCLALDCYQELYHNDMLEEGEVDVRVTSFKGCWQKYYLKGIRSEL